MNFLDQVKDSLKSAGSNLVSSAADELKNKYLQPGSLSGAPVTVTGNNVPVPAGTNQTGVRATTLPETPSMAPTSMSTGKIVVIVLAVLAAAAIGYKLVK